jgi:hypothetical protein
MHSFTLLQRRFTKQILKRRLLLLFFLPRTAIEVRAHYSLHHSIYNPPVPRALVRAVLQLRTGPARSSPGTRTCSRCRCCSERSAYVRYLAERMGAKNRANCQQQPRHDTGENPPNEYTPKRTPRLETYKLDTRTHNHTHENLLSLRE